MKTRSGLIWGPELTCTGVIPDSEHAFSVALTHGEVCDKVKTIRLTLFTDVKTTMLTRGLLDPCCVCVELSELDN